MEVSYQGEVGSLYTPPKRGSLHCYEQWRISKHINTHHLWYTQTSGGNIAQRTKRAPATSSCGMNVCQQVESFPAGELWMSIKGFLNG